MNVMYYNAAVEGLAPGLAHQYRWNGTVAAYAWLSGGETLQRGYSLLYDGLDRLTTANYGEGPSLESYHTKYDEKAEYDCMGNPTWIYRRSPDVINDIRPSSPSDRLRLEYDGNHLVHVTDSVTSGHDYSGAFHFEDGADETVEYEYDANGNMTKDLNRNITEIRYNLLNLPSMIAFGDNTYIYYTYSATGEKLTTRYVVRFLPLLAPGGGDPSSTEAESSGGMGDDISGSGTRVLPSVNPSGDMTKNYCGNVVYDSGERMLLTDEGYVTFAADGTPQYHYYLKDHLGNVRVVMGQTGTVEQVNHYYAFGSLMRESTSPGVQPYKYVGKELDRYSGLDAYDFGARAYFSDRMQWSTMDPLSEKYYDMSPYVYCGGNPINFVDSIGMSYDWVQNQNNNKIEWHDDVTSPDNTPNGYSYIGRNSNDILHHYGFTSKVLSQNATLLAVGREGDSSANITQLKTTKTTALLSLEAVTTIDNSAKTYSNTLGLTFKGIKNNGYFTQDNITSNPNYSFLYGGTLHADIQGTATNSNLVFRKGPSLNIPGNVTKEASIFISQDLLNRGTTIQNVKIDVGYPSTFLVRTHSFMFNIYK